MSIQNEIFSVIIEKNTKIPITKSSWYSTTHDNQSGIILPVVQGPDHEQYPNAKSEPNKTIWEAEMGVTRAKVDDFGYEVTFSLDEDGVLHVKAEEFDVRNKVLPPKKTEKKINFDVKLAAGLSKKEMQEATETHRENMGNYLSSRD